MKKILLIFLIVFSFASCNVSRDTTQSLGMDYSYLALGDSYTIGEGVELIEAWPVQLRNRLLERGVRVAPPKIIARTGWTTRDLIRNMEEELHVHRDFHLVSILIGVNNQYQNRSISEFEQELRELFRKAITHSKMRERGVFALTIPDYGVTPFGMERENAELISPEIDRFNAVIRTVAEDFNVQLFNITPLSREAATNLELLAEDNLHPSGLMYRLWVDEIIDEIAQKLPPLGTN